LLDSSNARNSASTLQVFQTITGNQEKLLPLGNQFQEVMAGYDAYQVGAVHNGQAMNMRTHH
jgi:hypothetical protein